MAEVGQVRGRVAALDLGDVWTGVALSDVTRQISRPVEVVGSGEVSATLRKLVREEGVCEVVVGVPKTMRGEVGFQARKILDKLNFLRDEFPGLRFVEWDERLTTRMAAENAGLARAKRAKKPGDARGRVDHLAAARMLQEYLEFRGGT